MSFVEAMQRGMKVSKQRACLEVKRHHISIEDFFAEFGIHEEYSAAEILGWLGY